MQERAIKGSSRKGKDECDGETYFHIGLLSQKKKWLAMQKCENKESRDGWGTDDTVE